MIVIPKVHNKVWYSVWRSPLGDEALDVLEKLTFTDDEDKDDYIVVSKKLLDYLTRKRGSKFTSRVFCRSLRQANTEPFSTYYCKLQSAAAPCRWEEQALKENMIEQIIAGHKDERVRALLFDLESDEVEKFVQKCEALKIASFQTAQVVKPGMPSSSNVDSLGYHRGGLQTMR